MATKETRTREELVRSYGGTIRKPYSGCAGYKTSRINQLTGGFLVVYDGYLQGIESPSDPPLDSDNRPLNWNTGGTAPPSTSAPSNPSPWRAPPPT